MTLQELDTLLTLSPADQQRIRRVLEWHPQGCGLVQAFLVAARHTAFTKRRASVLREDVAIWNYYGATAQRMLDFDVSLESAKRVFLAVKEPTPEQVCRVWDGR